MASALIWHFPFPHRFLLAFLGAPLEWSNEGKIDFCVYPIDTKYYKAALKVTVMRLEDNLPSKEQLEKLEDCQGLVLYFNPHQVLHPPSRLEIQVDVDMNRLLILSLFSLRIEQVLDGHVFCFALESFPCSTKLVLFATISITPYEILHSLFLLSYILFFSPRLIL